MDFYLNHWIRMFTVKRRRKVSDTADNQLSDMLMVLCLSQKFFSQRRIMTILPILLFCTLGVTGTQGRNEVDYTNIYCLETLICFWFCVYSPMFRWSGNLRKNSRSRIYIRLKFTRTGFSTWNSSYKRLCRIVQADSYLCCLHCRFVHH